jgi:putative amide transporter protein
MLLGVMLLYVGAVLVVNGIWLIGQARVARPAAAGEATTAAETHPTFIENREIAVLNVFTGFVGVVTATTLLVQGNQNEDLAAVRGGGLILLFAFTYLWVAANNFLNAGGRAFGWYCLFVAITAIPAGSIRSRTPTATTRRSTSASAGSAWAVLGPCSGRCLRSTGRSPGSLGGWPCWRASALHGCSGSCCCWT